MPEDKNKLPDPIPAPDTDAASKPLANLPVDPGKSHRRFQRPQAFASFRHRNYQLWFAGQLISVIGTWMQIIAQSWLVYQISKSEFALGLVSFASAIPVLLVSPWGGVVTDQVPKRSLLVITQSTSMLMAFVLAGLTFTNKVQVWHVILLAVILGIVNAFDAPARQSLVVDMVNREDIPNAIALNSMMFNGARVVGPAIGGFLLAAFGAGWCFTINGVTFLAVIAGLLAMRFPPLKIQRNPARPLQQFVEGVRYSRAHQDIFSLLIIAAVFSIFGTAYSAILPAFIVQALHSDAAGYGTINAFIGVGAMVGAFYLAQFGAYSKRGRTMMLANLIYPIMLGLFAFNTSFYIAMFLAFTLGLGFMLLLNNVNSLLQLRVEDTMRGRVMSLYTLSFFGFAPFGTLAIGAVGEAIPLNITIGISALLTFTFSLLVYFLDPHVAKID